MTGQPRVSGRQTIRLLKRLIKIPSVNPAIENGTGENAVGSFIADWFRKSHEFNVSEQRVGRDRFNVIAVLPGKGNGRSLMLNGHMDTVGTSGMTTKPFAAKTERGMIHGRGACDMKGALAAMMSAMLNVARSNKRLQGDLVFTGVVDEEYKSIGTWNLIKRFRADAAIVGEPTGLDVATAHKGYAWLQIETFGKRAHGSVPEKGNDAIEKMATIISGMEHLRQEHQRRRHPLVGTPKIHTSTITGGSEWSSVPGSCVLKVERRLIPGETPRDAANEINEIIRTATRQDNKINAKVQLIFHGDAMEVKKPPHLSILQKTARNAGAEGRIIGVPYWTDAAILVNQGRVPTCLFGPGDIAVAHSPDEYVSVNEVLKAANIYAGTAQVYCNID